MSTQHEVESPEAAASRLREALVTAIDLVIAAAVAAPGSARVTAMRDELADCYTRELTGAIERALRHQAAAFVVEFGLIGDGSDARH